MTTRQHHHHHYARSRRRLRGGATTLDEPSFRFLAPLDDGCAIVLADLADAATVAFELFEFDVQETAVMLLDEQRQVTAILLDSPGGIADAIHWGRQPDVAVDFCQLLVVVRRERVIDAPPLDEDVELYRAAREICSAHGVQWMDLLLANPHQLQSVGFVCDPDSIWHEDFDL
jgi:hypothetical protein